MPVPARWAPNEAKDSGSPVPFRAGHNQQFPASPLWMQSSRCGNRAETSPEVTRKCVELPGLAAEIAGRPMSAIQISPAARFPGNTNSPTRNPEGNGVIGVEASV